MEEETTETTEQAVDTTVEQLTQELTDLKANTVSREEYEKLKKDNATLIHKLGTERPVAQQQEVVDPTPEENFKRLQGNSKRLATEQLTGYEYAQLLVENEDLMNKLGIDPFGAEDEKTKQLKERNTSTSKLLREALEHSDSADQFDQYMNSHTITSK